MCRQDFGGDLVVGQYSHPFGTFSPNPTEPYFIFDTKHGTTIEFPTSIELQNVLGHPVTLTEVQFFQSPLAATRRKVVRAIEFTPPIAALSILIAFIWRHRTSDTPSPRNLYT